MHATCLQSDLRRALATASRAVAAKPAYPVLSNILLATDAGRLKLTATNLEIGITCWAGAKIEHDGAITVPARLLSDIVANLPNDTIDLRVDAHTQTLNIRCARFEGNVKGIDADEFPVIPAVSDAAPVALDAETLRDAIGQVASAAATLDARPTLTGVLLQLRDAQATLAAADGFRLSVRTIDLPAPVAQPQDVIVPARALQELARSVAGSDGVVEMVVASSGGHVLFRSDELILVSRLIDGKFPDYNRIIPASHTTRCVVDVQELAKAVRLASYFASRAANVVKLTTESGAPGSLTLAANAVDVGDDQYTLDALVDGPAIEIALNATFVAELLSVLKAGQVAIELQSPLDAALLRPVDGAAFIHIIMPMSVS